MVRRDWRVIVKEAEEIAREYSERYGVAPTLRGIFYILVSKGVISNTRSDYVYLSKVLSKKRYAGEFDPKLIEDRSRRVNVGRKSAVLERDIAKARQRLLKEIELSIWFITRFYINPWDDQRRRVIIVLEKDALYPLIDNMVRKITGELVEGERWDEPAYVEEIRVIRGYDSATDIYKLAEKLKSIPHSITPAILLLGDFDPSGEDIVRDFQYRLEMLSTRYDAIFEKVAVTLHQIMELDLPAAPLSQEEVRKMVRDPRYRRYVAKLEEMAEIDKRYRELIERYRRPDGTLAMRVELDALAALKPEYLEKVLAEAIKRHFDAKTYLEKTKPKIEEQERIAKELREELEKEVMRCIESTTSN